MEKTKGAESLRKSLRLLDIVKGVPSGMDIATLVAASGLARPTTYRIVAALVEEGFLDQDDKVRTVRLGPKLLELAQSVWSDGDLRQSARGELDRLAASKGLIALLMVRSGDRMTCIEISAPDPSRSPWRVGTTLPVAESAAGKAILAFGDWGHIDHELEALLPDATGVARLRLKSELGVARSRFYAIEFDADAAPDAKLNGVAAPIFDFSGTPIAAIVIFNDPTSAKQRALHDMGAAVVQAARAISSARGGYPFGIGVPQIDLAEGPTRARRIAKRHCLIGDSPIVDAGTGEIFWIDILGPSFLRHHEARGETREITLSEVVGALLRLDDGRFLVAQQTQLAVLDRTGRQVWARSAVGLPAGFRYNDGAIDAGGRIWLGTMDMATSQGAGVLHRFETLDDDPTTLPGFSLPNGIGFSDDTTKMFVIDSMEKTLSIFDYDVRDGTASQRRRIPMLGGVEGRPSGLAIGPTGDLFTCHWDGGHVLKFNESGDVLDRYPIPVPRPSGIAYDPAGNRLIVTSARVRLSTAEVSRFEQSGSVFEIPLD